MVMKKLMMALCLMGTMVGAQDVDPRCKVSKIKIRITKLGDLCSTQGAVALRAVYFNARGRRIDAIACQVDPPTWGSNIELKLDQTGFLALVEWLQPGDEEPISIAMMQNDQVFVEERLIKY
jgi:hypothetical protein